MTTPTASLTIGDLVFSGVDDTNPFALYAMNEPGLQARLTYASDSPYIEGSLATAGAWQQALLNVTVGVGASSETELESRKQQIRAAVAQFRYVVVTEVNGLRRSWTADMGSMSPVDDSLDVNDLAEFAAAYNLTIPVLPIPEVL